MKIFLSASEVRLVESDVQSCANHLLFGGSAEYVMDFVDNSIESHFFYVQDGEGRPSEFVALLLKQYQQESKQFVEDISQALAGKRYARLLSIAYIECVRYTVSVCGKSHACEC